MESGSIVAKIVVEVHFVRMESRSKIVVSVVRTEFVRMEIRYVFERIVVEGDCARLYYVACRHSIGGTKNIACVPLSICSRVSPWSTITR